MSTAPASSIAHSPATWLQRPRTWWTILRICLEERLVYRADFMLGTLMRFLPLVTQIFLWSAVFAANGNKEIVGFSYHDFIAYYLMATIARAFSSMPGLAGGIARDIRDGTIKKYLTQPVDLLGFLFLSRIAHKVVYYTVAALPFALVFYLCRDYFPPLPDAVTWVAFFASLLMAFLLGFLIESLIGMLGFWFLEVSAMMFVYMLFNFFFSGQMFPINMLPGIWGTIVKIIPLQYLAYFPAAVFLGKIQGAELVQGLLIEVVWIVVFFVACRVAFRRGVARYSGFGG